MELKFLCETHSRNVSNFTTVTVGIFFLHTKVNDTLWPSTVCHFSSELLIFPSVKGLGCFHTPDNLELLQYIFVIRF